MVCLLTDSGEPDLESDDSDADSDYVDPPAPDSSTDDDEIIPIQGRMATPASSPRAQPPRSNSRKKLRQEANWKKEKLQTAYRKGERVVKKGEVLTREIGLRCNHNKKAVYDCPGISDEQRKQIFNQYYSLSTRELQRNYIVSCVDVKPKGRQKDGDTRQYFVVVGSSRRRV